MIEYNDFVKLFCIHNAYRYNTPKDCYSAAIKLADVLYENGEFDSKNQVIPNDFLAVLNDIKESL